MTTKQLSENEGHLKRFWRWMCRHEIAVMAAVALILAGTSVFIQIADEVLEGDSRHFDMWVLESLRNPENFEDPIGPYWLEVFAMDMTALGGNPVLLFFTFVVASYLLLIRKSHAMWLVLGASIGGQILANSLKHVFLRERPNLVPHLAETSTASFPSSHAMMSAVVYLTLGVLLTRIVERRFLKLYIMSVAISTTLIVGLTRVYLGVHYPTDVMAGWCAGLVWAMLCYLGARALQKHGAVEQPGEEPELQHA